MAAYPFVTCDVFTDRPFGGNPLAVLPSADGLDAAQMQAIANEFNLSETVFVLPPVDQSNDLRFRIFTPRSELPFAGHPTVGGAVMAVRDELVAGERLRIEEPVGVVPVEIHRQGPTATGATLDAAQPPVRGGRVDAAAMARVLGLPDGTTSTGVVWSCGLPFVIVAVDSIADLGRISVDTHAMRSELAPLDTADVYAVAVTDTGVRARMFAPFDGIPEDPATGSAACAFAGWWVAVRSRSDGDHQVLIDQGVEMGRPSRIRMTVSVTAGVVERVRVGGDVVAISTGTLHL